MSSVRRNPLNGRITKVRSFSYEDANAQEASAAYFWSSTENSSNNSWNVNFSSGNTNNNNKYNSYRVRAVAAYGEDFSRFLDTVYKAYRDCLRGKMTSTQAVEYMQIAYIDLVFLAVELWTGTYKPSTSTCFLVKYPKYREVFAACFRDRIVHHWIFMYINPLFENRFTRQGNVSHNCRKGFGTRTAVEAAAEGMRYVSGNYQSEAWVFKGDLVSFFMSIDKRLLLGLLEKFIKRFYNGEYKDILSFSVMQTVLHCPELDCVINGKPEEWKNLDESKSMHRNGQDRGEPIGNLTTQIFANFLLSFLDSFVRWVMRKHKYSYIRFVDDFLIICNDMSAFKEAIPKIEQFLSEKLLLKLHKNKRYLQPVSHGVLFVGCYIKPGRLYLSNRTIGRFEEKVNGFNNMIKETELNAEDCLRIQSVINSYLGFCKGKRTYSIRKRVMSLLENGFYRYFYISGHYDKVVIRKPFRKLNKELNYELSNNNDYGKKTL